MKKKRFESECDDPRIVNLRAEYRPRWTVKPIMEAIKRIATERPGSLAGKLLPLSLMSVARSLRRYRARDFIYNDDEILSALWKYKRAHPEKFEGYTRPNAFVSPDWRLI